METLPPKPFIDLTGHLSSLKSSLTPDSKQFEPAPPLWQLDRPAEDPAPWFMRLFLVFLLITAATLAAYACASQ